MVAQLFAIIAPILVCSALGYGWARIKAPFHSETLGSLVFLVGTPCLVFSTLTSIRLEAAVFGAMALSAATVLALAAACGALILRLSGLRMTTYLPSLMFPNSGNMGLPLALFAYGEQGLALAIAYFFLHALCQFTIGASLAAGSANIARMLRLPLIYAVAVALAYLVSGSPVPPWLSNTTEVLGALTIPLMLILLGHSLAKLGVADVKTSLALAVARLAIGLGVGITVAWLLGLEGPPRGVVILLSAMPAAVFNFVFAERFGREPQAVAGLVITSTSLSFVTLPLLLWFVLL
jgi:predicted permease